MAPKKKATKKVAPKKAAKKAAPKKAAKKAAPKKAAKKAAPKKAAKKSTKRAAKKVVDMIISKTRTKKAVEECNVSSDFYAALNEYVVSAISAAEGGAKSNGRKTLRPQDL